MDIYIHLNFYLLLWFMDSNSSTNVKLYNAAVQMTTFFSYWICKRLINNRTGVNVSALPGDTMCMVWAGGRHSFACTLSKGGESPQKSNTPITGPPPALPSQAWELPTVPKKIPGQSASCPLAQASYPCTNGILINFTLVLGAFLQTPL